MGILLTSEPIVPASGFITIERIRKVRNKPYYRIHYRMSDGTRTTGIMRPRTTMQTCTTPSTAAYVGKQINLSTGISRSSPALSRSTQLQTNESLLNKTLAHTVFGYLIDDKRVHPSRVVVLKPTPERTNDDQG